MADSGRKTYNQKVDELIKVITLQKLRLVNKYGPQVKKLWEREE